MGRFLTLSRRNLFGCFGALIAVTAIPIAPNVEILTPVNPIDAALAGYKALVDWWNLVSDQNVIGDYKQIQKDLCDRTSVFLSFLLENFPRNYNPVDGFTPSVNDPAIVSKSSVDQMRHIFKVGTPSLNKSELAAFNPEIVPLVFVRHIVKYQKLPIKLDLCPAMKNVAEKYSAVVLAI